ncbi:MAG: SUMF1/EgtB/PvdO family nonheme iron enzyme [Rhodothermales bacterium]|nr:SUMF1/EgtB/PvdO family nonheme iron enzyme [Rhodothermales bacterium]MBO6778408.1 SUMF1/EgtB/PvdO family nonheme iron enzyme [Rhodothermales bacterium]
MTRLTPALLLLLVLPARAADLRIENVRVDATNADTSTNTVSLTFDVSWTGSWRTNTNHDAAWIIARFEREPGVWSDLRFAVDGHSAQGVKLKTSPLSSGTSVGLLVLASGQETTQASVSAVWHYGASGLEALPAPANVRLTGIEMVFVPPGPHLVGSPAATNGFYAAGSEDGFWVTSEDELAVGTGDLHYDVPEGEEWTGGDGMGPVPAAWPKGTAGFYIMKFAATEGQYAAMLSTLPTRARMARDVSAYPQYRENGGTITCYESDCVSAMQDKHAAFLTWADGIAFASWAGLRPMTEFEYEKAASGTPDGEKRYDDGNPPVSVYTSRRTSDWGVVDMRGGLWERVVTLGNPQGRAFAGSPGRGFLDELGQPYGFMNPDWPGPQAIGSGFRGGTEGVLGLSATADRTYGAYEASYGNQSQGFRGVLDVR